MLERFSLSLLVFAVIAITLFLNRSQFWRVAYLAYGAVLLALGLATFYTHVAFEGRAHAYFSLTIDCCLSLLCSYLAAKNVSPLAYLRTLKARHQAKIAATRQGRNLTQ